MNIAISNIAWPKDQEAAVANKLVELGVTQVEVAPTAVWSDPLSVSSQDLQTYRKVWEDRGIEIIALQSLLYGHPELTLFDSAEVRQSTQTYIEGMIRIAGELGAKAMVFGSPKNRLRGELSEEAATDIAKEFFNTLGTYATEHGTHLCVEPNPVDYACDYITTGLQGVELVKAVDNPGFRLHLDAAGMQLAKDDCPAVIAAALPVLQHFHCSEPFLAPVGEATSLPFHTLLAKALTANNYTGTVSIEMKTLPPDEVISGVSKAVRFAQEIY